MTRIQYRTTVAGFVAALAAMASLNSQAQVALNPSSRVTADKTKAGFVWRVFNNSANQNNNNQRTEDALAGLLKGTDGALLVNNADPAAQGIAIAPAAAPSPDNAPITFEIETVINLNQTEGGGAGTFTPDDQMPGIPGVDGATDGTAAEIITYLDLTPGTYTMAVSSDDGFRTSSGNLKDAFQGVQLGEFNGGRGASETAFTFSVSEAGVYPFRTTYEEGGGDSNIEWYTIKADGTKVLVNDVANGGIKAYRALAAGGTPQPPYVKSVTPSPVPRQANVVSSSVVLVLNDGDTVAIDDSSIDFKVDGKAVTEKKRDGQTVTLTYKPEGIQFPNEVHTASLTFKGAGGFTRTENWSFRNLKNVVLPASPVVGENFDSTEEGKQPAGWVPTNFTVPCIEGEDLFEQKSDTYKNWVVIKPETANPAIDDNAMDAVNPNETLNGVPVTIEVLRSGNFLYAESDSRCNGTNPTRPAAVTADNPEPNYGQIQYIVTKPFDLSTVANPVLSFSSGYLQNQDSHGAVEYSVDAGKTWAPVVIFMDIPTILVKPDGTIDGPGTLNAPRTDTAIYTDNGVVKGNTYGDYLASPINASIGDYIAPRVNDDGTEGKRIEIFRLPAAANKADVRLRLSASGSDSWYFWVDNIAFYDIAPAVVNSGYKIGLNFGADEANASNSGTLAATDRAGVPSVAQANWNNLTLLSGANTAPVVADNAGVAETTSMSVKWASANTWASTGRGEENNSLTGADKALLTGYLDTGAASTSRVELLNLPAPLVDKGYDVYVYALGGVPGRGGSYRILDGATGLVLRDSIRAQSSSNNTAYIEVPTNLGASGNGASTLLFGSGNYMVFRGLTASSIVVESRTAAAGGGVGISGTPRAPINAVQLVSPAGGSLADDVSMPGDAVTVTSLTSRSPAAEMVPNAIDNNALTKFLDFNDGDSSAPFKGPVGLTIRPSAGASIVTGLALTSANDAPERDPASYILEGSNDNGATYTKISEGAVAAFAKRFTRQVIEFSNSTAYSLYRVTIPTVANATTANSMQVAEVELLGQVVAPKITSLTRNANGSLTLQWKGGGTLQAAPTVNGPWADVAGATSPYTLNPTEASIFGRIKK